MSPDTPVAPPRAHAAMANRLRARPPLSLLLPSPLLGGQKKRRDSFVSLRGVRRKLPE